MLIYYKTADFFCKKYEYTYSNIEFLLQIEEKRQIFRRLIKSYELIMNNNLDYATYFQVKI